MGVDQTVEKQIFSTYRETHKALFNVSWERPFPVIQEALGRHLEYALNYPTGIPIFPIMRDCIGSNHNPISSIFGGSKL